jgi:hypothetical protein
MTKVTPKIDLRAKFGPVRDQGQRPTCLAFAVSDTHAALRTPWAALSCEYVFYHAQRRASRPPTTGAELPHMLDALREDGQPIESAWAYLANSPSNTWAPPSLASPLFILTQIA